MPETDGQSESVDHDIRGVSSGLLQQLRRHRRDAMCAVLLFVLAVGLRVMFLASSETYVPIRADALRYVRSAGNLKLHGDHSIDEPHPDLPPLTRTDTSPGYPLFLTLFLRQGMSQAEFLNRVRSTQALLGGVTVVLTYLLARLALSLRWSLLAGMLTALSPHLIAIDHYILSESLFTVVLMQGTFFTAIGWVKERPGMVLVGSVLLSFAAQIRAVAYLLAPFVGIAFLLRPHVREWSYRKLLIWQLSAIFLGYAGMLVSHQVFTRVAGFPAESATVAAQGQNAELHQRYVKFKTPQRYFLDSLKPPNFFVTGQSHINEVNHDPVWKLRTKRTFAEEPWAYIQWSVWGRWYYIWCFDNAYFKGVYLYQMLHKGFEENGFLWAVHGVMWLLHWPLYLLSLGGVVTLALSWWRRRLDPSTQLLFVPALVFVYLLLIPAIVWWLPRYTIPARPVSYIMAAAALSWISQAVRSRQAGVAVADTAARA